MALDDPHVAVNNNIKVVVRARPFTRKGGFYEMTLCCSNSELSRNEKPVLDIQQDQVILGAISEEIDKAGEKSLRPFRFDCCWNAGSQAEIFQEIGVPLVDNAFKGFNNCIFAYGQTGSGKSYTMMGVPNDENQQGIIPRIARELFRRMQENKHQGSLKHTVEMSYFEIYNEKVRDLLNPKSSSNLRIREHPSLGPYVEDLSKLVVETADKIYSLISEGNKTRTVASTEMNQTSSRSHAVVTITLTQKIVQVSKESAHLSSEKVSRISLVDLAGSERSSMAGTSGLRLKEGGEINKSLTTLGRVISTLSNLSLHPNRRKSMVVPYRESTLTWLLKDSLGGNSMTTMIATLSMSRSNYNQTVSTLRFADSAKKIQNNAVVNEDPNAKLVRELKEELDALKAKLASHGATTDDVTKELTERLHISEKLLAEVNQTWEERLEKTHRIQTEREKALEELGIDINNPLIGMRTPRKVPHIVNLSEDPLLAECLVYNIRSGVTRVGNAVQNDHAQIRLQGDYIAEDHCYFRNDNGKVTLCPVDPDAFIMVNGIRRKEEVVLQSGCRIILGGSHVFRFNNPLEKVRQHRPSISTPTAGSPLRGHSLMADEIESPMFTDWEYALYEARGRTWTHRRDTSSVDLDNVQDLLFQDIDKYQRPPMPLFSGLRPSNTGVRRQSVSQGDPFYEESSYNSATTDEVIRERERLIEKYVKLWKTSHLVKLAKHTLSLTRLIKEAQVLAKRLDARMMFQTMVLDGTGYRPSLLDSDRVERSGSGIAHENNAIVCVRVMDSETSVIRIWSQESFINWLERARNLAILSENAKLLEHVHQDHLLTPEDSQRYTYVGYAVFPVCGLGRGEVDVFSPYTHAVDGQLSVTSYGTLIKEVALSGLSSGEISEVHLVFSMLEAGNEVRVFHTTRTISLSKESRSWKDLVRLPKSDGMIRIEIYGLVTQNFIDRLRSWDELQEPGLLESTTVGDGYGSSYVFLTCEVLELNEGGAYSTAEVVRDKSGKECILVHQGLQRRLRFTAYGLDTSFGHPAITIDNIRLVDPQGIAHQSGGDPAEIKIVGRVINDFDPNGHSRIQFQGQWDSSAHQSIFLDRTTKHNYKVILGVQLRLGTVLYTFDLPVLIRPRTSALSRVDLMLGSFIAIGWITLYFEVGKLSAVPKIMGDFWRLDAASTRVPHEDLLGSWRPRGVSILREFFNSEERIKRKSSLAETRSLLEKLTFPPKARNHGIDLTEYIDLWNVKLRTPDTRVSIFILSYPVQ
jgi:kinesin family protein 1